MYSEAPDIVSFPTAFCRELRTQTQHESLKSGTLCLLDKVDVHWASRQGLESLGTHSAKVDWETEIARIPQRTEPDLPWAPLRDRTRATKGDFYQRSSEDG